VRDTSRSFNQGKRSTGLLPLDYTVSLPSLVPRLLPCMHRGGVWIYVQYLNPLIVSRKKGIGSVRDLFPDTPAETHMGRVQGDVLLVPLISC